MVKIFYMQLEMKIKLILQNLDTYKKFSKFCFVAIFTQTNMERKENYPPSIVSILCFKRFLLGLTHNITLGLGF